MSAVFTTCSSGAAGIIEESKKLASLSGVSGEMANFSIKFVRDPSGVKGSLTLFPSRLPPDAGVGVPGEPYCR